MNKKLSEKFCIFFVLIVFIFIGYFTYRSYSDKRDSDDSIEINDFYNVDYLFNNSYIDTPKTIDDFSSKDGNFSIYLDSNNTMYIKHLKDEKYNKKVTGLPKGKVTVYYNYLYDDYYEFMGMTDDHAVYYSFVKLNSSKDYVYSLIGDNIDKVYVPFYDKKGVYVNRDGVFATNYMLYDNGGNFKYVDCYFGKKYVLKADANVKKPYFDYICPTDNSNVCNKLLIYISFNNELIYKEKYLLDNGGKKIFVKDVFSTFKIDGKNIDFGNIPDNLLKQNDYLFSTYIIDVNQMLYRYDINKKGEEMVSLNNETNKIKEYIYESNVKLTIVFEDNTKTEIKADDNTMLVTSTIYDKNKSDNKVIVQP